MLQITGKRPQPGVLFGITHSLDGAPIVREARVLKVSIGVPKGRGLTAFMRPDGLWYFRMARRDQTGKVGFESSNIGVTRAIAEKFYRENYSKAEELSAPRKLPYFTFTRPVTQENGMELHEPDWDAIEAHGPMPTEIDIVFLDDNPFSGAYQMWSATEMQCRGDGLVAQRVLSLAANDNERALAEQSKKDGSKYFPIIEGCWMNGCSYSKPVVKGNKEYPSPCKPGGDLKFQLASNIRVGGTAYFHTTGYRSISHIFSSLERIKALTGGRLAGIPLKMVLRPYRTKHNGQAATQFGVSLEFRAEDIQALRKNLMEQAWKFRELAVPTPTRHYLEAPNEPAIDDDDDEEAPHSAPTMANEFYADGGEDFSEPAAAPKGAEAATRAKTTELAEKLAQNRSKKQAAPAAPPPPPVAAAPAPDPAPAQAQPVDEEYRDEPPEDPEDPRFKQPGDVF